MLSIIPGHTVRDSYTYGQLHRATLSGKVKLIGVLSFPTFITFGAEYDPRLHMYIYISECVVSIEKGFRLSIDGNKRFFVGCRSLKEDYHIN